MLSARYPTKKLLKASVGLPLHYEETSMFGPEYTATGEFAVVGPSPTTRTWFATVVMRDGLIAKVT